MRNFFRSDLGGFLLAALIVFASSLFFYGCGHPGYYNTQRGAAIGAGVGAIAGQAIGRNTESTLLGAGIGGILGLLGGNAIDQANQQQRDAERNQGYGREEQGGYYSHDSDYGYGGSYNHGGYGVPPQPETEPPRGEWVTVPGRWEGGVWVPPHRAWQTW